MDSLLDNFSEDNTITSDEYSSDSIISMGSKNVKEEEKVTEEIKKIINYKVLEYKLTDIDLMNVQNACNIASLRTLSV